MYQIDLSFISGVSLGIELVSGEQINEDSVDWSIAIDLLILRIIFIKLRSLFK